MKNKISKIARWLFTGAILVFLVYFARSVDWSAAWKAVKSAYLPLVLVAVLVNLLTVVLKGVRWWLFLKPAGAPSLSLAIRAMLAGTGLNNILIANGGEAARVMFVSRATKTSSSTVLATLALERMFDPIGFVILLAYTLSAYKLPEPLDRWRFAAQALLVLIVLLLIWFIHHARHVTPEHIPERQTTSDRIWLRFKAYIAAFFLSTRALSTGGRFTWAVVISLFAWIAQLFTFIWCARAVDVHMPLAGHLITLLAVNLVFIIRSTPGNLGVFQMAYILASAKFGVNREAALAVSFLIQTIQLIPVTLIGAAITIVEQPTLAGLSLRKKGTPQAYE